MDRKTKHDYNKTILMMERMGLKDAAQKLEENLNEAFSISAYEAGMQDAKEGLEADASRAGHESFEKDYMDGYEDGLPEGELKEGDMDKMKKRLANLEQELDYHDREGDQPAIARVVSQIKDLKAKMKGLSEDAKPDFLDLDKDGDKEEPMKQAAADAKNEEQDIFAPNHYCVHHGGVQHNGSIAMAEAVGHNWNEELGRVTHYDMKLEDGTVLEGIAFEDIQVTNASLANEHMHSMGAHADDEEEEEDQNENTETTNTGLPGISEEMLREAIRNVIARMKNNK